MRVSIWLVVAGLLVSFAAGCGGQPTKPIDTKVPSTGPAVGNNLPKLPPPPKDPPPK